MEKENEKEKFPFRFKPLREWTLEDFKDVLLSINPNLLSILTYNGADGDYLRNLSGPRDLTQYLGIPGEDSQKVWNEVIKADQITKTKSPVKRGVSQPAEPPIVNHVVDPQPKRQEFTFENAIESKEIKDM
eukprot:TRINITY_DN1633_c0_g2_i3.p1 TRINITY_DN1633_c0_g2~~TRINITY_DN1633_c0_g2_i3.p1  ORF type:complete len:131 (+),score=16.64 TRINITY_DN1633_c0_g2_i3:48-440(+)